MIILLIVAIIFKILYILNINKIWNEFKNELIIYVKIITISIHF